MRHGLIVSSGHDGLRVAREAIDRRSLPILTRIPSVANTILVRQ
jgi:hypothetical protein